MSSKAYKGGKTLADYGDGGAANGGGLSVYGGAPRISGRMDGPKGPSGPTSPGGHGGAPTLIAYPSPKLGGGAAGKGESSSAGATTPPSGANETGF